MFFSASIEATLKFNQSLRLKMVTWPLWLVENFSVAKSSVIDAGFLFIGLGLGFSLYQVARFSLGLFSFANPWHGTKLNNFLSMSEIFAKAIKSSQLRLASEPSRLSIPHAIVFIDSCIEESCPVPNVIKLFSIGNLDVGISPQFLEHCNSSSN